MKLSLVAMSLPDGRVALAINNVTVGTCDSWDDAQKVISQFIEQHKLTLTRFAIREFELRS